MAETRNDSAPLGQWQSIETAPLNPPGKANGPWILVFSEYDHVIRQARFVAAGNGGDWVAKDQVERPAMSRRYITHWMPLLPIPIRAKAKGGAA